jgi:hypothetical protein
MDAYLKVYCNPASKVSQRRIILEGSWKLLQCEFHRSGNCCVKPAFAAPNTP